MPNIHRRPGARYWGAVGPGSGFSGQGVPPVILAQGAPLTVLCPGMGQTYNINSVSLMSPSPEPRIEPGTQQVPNMCLNRELGVWLSGEGKRNRFKLDSFQWRHVSIKRLPILLSDKKLHIVRPKKNKNLLAKCISRKFAQFFSASVILDSIQTPIRHC